MPPRTRVPRDAGDSITEASDLLQKAMQILQGVDLRSVQGATKTHLQSARSAAQTAVAETVAALRSELEALSTYPKD